MRKVTYMGWNRAKYYTRSRKVNGKVVREYVGVGLLGRLAAEEDAAKREQLQQDREAWAIRRNEINANDESFAEQQVNVAAINSKRIPPSLYWICTGKHCAQMRNDDKM